MWCARFIVLIASHFAPIAADAPLRILFAHEQHLQPMGCDVRLLGIIRSMLGQGAEVSLYFRSHTLIAKRAPPSADLATLLRIPRGYREEWLRRDVRQLPPPAMYEHAGPAQLARLFARGWFPPALVFFWFWHDPEPHVAAMLLHALLLVACKDDPVDSAAPDWTPDLVCPGAAGCTNADGPLHAAAAVRDITPPCFESWTDVDGDGSQDIVTSEEGLGEDVGLGVVWYRNPSN